MFFHSIVLNSEFAERVRNFKSYQNWSKQQHSTATPMISEETFNLRYIDWSGEHSGLRECPAVLDERDLIPLINSASLFARKFEQGISDELLGKINQHIKPL